MPDAAPLEPGDPRSLGQYEIVGRLGAGGQGAVFLGRAPGGLHVAVKLLHAQMAADPAARARFIREVGAAQKVEAFCTAKVLDADVHGDQPYVISEFIDGPSLHDVVAHNGPFDAAGLERLAIGTATALAAIHEAGIVHRDFKPNNVMLASDGPRVVDFGIARTVNSQESAVTATGMVVGTPGYLAPEQLTGAPLTPAVDIFAWGATMVFAATGQSPFEADTLPVIINKILNDEPDLSRIPAGPVRDMIGRCLSKDAGLRPPAAQLLIHLLQAVGADPSRQNGGEDLLDQGTRIAAQLPMPPAPPQRHITPPPMPMQGTPPPPHGQPPAQPHITPPPMPMYQNAGMQQPPPPQQGRPPMGQPMGQPMGGPPPGYAPPPRRSGSGPGLAIGLGCGAIALVGIIVVVVLIIIGSNSDDPDPYTPSYSPSYSPSYGGGIDIGMIGVWNGTGYQSGKSFRTKFAILTDNGTATYTYTDGTPTCITRLTLSSGSTEKGSTRAVFSEQPFSPSSTCGAGTITFTKSGASNMSWSWRGTSGGSAYGSITK